MERIMDNYLILKYLSKISPEGRDILEKLCEKLIEAKSLPAVQAQRDRYKEALEKAYKRLYGSTYEGMSSGPERAINETLRILDVDNRYHNIATEALPDQTAGDSDD
jgi:hypothetical protein